MKRLKQKKTAIIITIAAIVIFTFIGTTKSLNSLTDDIEKTFYSGVYNEEDNYTEVSISSQLEKRIDASLGLLTIASNYEEFDIEAESLRNARHELIDARTIGEKYLANEHLENAYQSLAGAIGNNSFAEDDSEAFISYTDTMEGAQGIIEKSNYNDSVREYYNSITNAFPVKFLKFFADSPEYFNVEG